MIRRWLCGLTLLLLLPGCRLAPRTEEDTYRDLIKKVDELTGVLIRVMNASTAEDARPKVQKIGPTLIELKQMRDQNLRTVGNPKMEELKNRYEPVLTASITRLLAQIQRIQMTVPAAKELSAELQTLVKAGNIAVK